MRRGFVGHSLLLVLTATSANTQELVSQKTAAIVVDEQKDGLPGAKSGPSRMEIEELIRAIGRDPVSDELVDRIDALFRPHCASRRQFEVFRSRALDSISIAKIDAVMVELTKKPADTRTLIQHAAYHQWDPQNALIRKYLSEDLAHAKGPRKTIRGRIIDQESNKPIVGAVILSQGERTARTDGNGEYSLNTPPVEGVKLFFLAVEAPGYALTHTILDWAAMKETEVQDFRLPKSIVFGGRVVDSNGTAIVGADVELQLQAKATYRDVAPERRAMAAVSTFRARTDRDGIYAFRCLPAEADSQQLAMRLSVLHPNYRIRTKQYSSDEMLGPGWEITLEPGFSVRGVIVNDRGKPVPNAWVQTDYAPFDVKWPGKFADAQGHFRFDNLPPEGVQLFVSTESYLPYFSHPKPENGEPPEIKIILDKGEYLEGKAVDEEDKPVGGVSVGYLKQVDDDGKVLLAGGDLAGRTTVTRDDGTFRIGPVPKGRYRLRAIRSGNGKGEVNGFSHAHSGSKDVVVKFGTVAK